MQFFVIVAVSKYFRVIYQVLSCKGFVVSLLHMFTYAALTSMHCESPAKRSSSNTNVRHIIKKFATFFRTRVFVYYIGLLEWIIVLRQVVFHKEVGDLGVFVIYDDV